MRVNVEPCTRPVPACRRDGGSSATRRRQARPSGRSGPCPLKRRLRRHELSADDAEPSGARRHIRVGRVGDGRSSRIVRRQPRDEPLLLTHRRGAGAPRSRSGAGRDPHARCASYPVAARSTRSLPSARRSPGGPQLVHQRREALVVTPSIGGGAKATDLLVVRCPPVGVDRSRVGVEEHVAGKVRVRTVEHAERTDQPLPHPVPRHRPRSWSSPWSTLRPCAPRSAPAWSRTSAHEHPSA